MKIMKRLFISISFFYLLLLSVNCLAQTRFSYPINPNKKGWLDYRTASDPQKKTSLTGSSFALICKFVK